MFGLDGVIGHAPSAQPLLSSSSSSSHRPPRRATTRAGGAHGHQRPNTAYGGVRTTELMAGRGAEGSSTVTYACSGPTAACYLKDAAADIDAAEARHDRLVRARCRRGWWWRAAGHCGEWWRQRAWCLCGGLRAAAGTAVAAGAAGPECLYDEQPDGGGAEGTDGEGDEGGRPY